MINTNRIVPVQATDLITLYGTILKAANVSASKLAAGEIGKFQVTTNSATLLCDEPAVKIDFDATTSSVSAGTVYFVPAYNYAGFTIDGAAVTPSGDVVADGATLYKAVLATGAITITKVGV